MMKLWLVRPVPQHLLSILAIFSHFPPLSCFPVCNPSKALSQFWPQAVFQIKRVCVCVCVCVGVWVCLCVGVGVCVLAAQSCLTLCNPMDYSPPGSSIHGLLQARMLERVAISFSGDLYNPGIKPGLLCNRHILYCLNHQHAKKGQLMSGS